MDGLVSLGMAGVQEHWLQIGYTYLLGIWHCRPLRQWATV